MRKAFLVAISIAVISAYFVWAIGRAIDIEFQEAENVCELSE
jgi:hypothetical protein